MNRDTLSTKSHASFLQEHQNLVNSVGGAARQNLPITLTNKGGRGAGESRLSALRQFATDQLCKFFLLLCYIVSCAFLASY